MQKQKGCRYLSCQERTPKGLGIKVNCPDFINCLFSSTCHMRLGCPLRADKPYRTWNRKVSQDKIKKKTITPHKLTALKSIAKVAVLIGLTAVRWMRSSRDLNLCTLQAVSAHQEKWRRGGVNPKLNLALKYPLIESFRCE